MLIHRLSEKIADILATHIGWQNKTAVLTYGFELIIGESFKLALLISLSALFDLLTPTLLIMFTAIPFRLLTGGTHCTTYFRCVVLTLFAYLVLAAAASELYPFLANESSFVILPILLIIGLTAIKLWVPCPNPNRSFDLPEIAKFRRLSRLFLISWGLVCLLFGIFAAGPAFTMFFVSTAMGILWQIFLVSPPGTRFFNVIEKIFNFFLKPKEVN